MPQPVVDLITLKYDMERRRTAVERLDRVRAALRTEEARREQLAAQLRLEQEDVERLEGMSFASFVATLRGLREERLRMEREEYVRAKLGYDTCEEAIRALTAQMTELEREIESLQGADERYAAALSGREEHLLASDASTRRRLLPLVEELGTLRAAARELDEAEAAAHAADAALSHVATLLKKAEAGHVGPDGRRHDRHRHQARPHREGARRGAACRPGAATAGDGAFRGTDRGRGAYRGPG